MFDLESAIKSWLKLFRKHQAFYHGSIREMELHLRDHIDDILATGLSEQDAFEMAVKEFGDTYHGKGRIPEPNTEIYIFQHI